LERPDARHRVFTTIQPLIPIRAVSRRVGHAVDIPLDVQGASLHAVVAAVHGTVEAAVGVLLAFHARGGTIDVVAFAVGASEDSVHSFVPGVEWRGAGGNIDVVGGYCGASQLALKMRGFFLE